MLMRRRQGGGRLATGLQRLGVVLAAMCFFMGLVALGHGSVGGALNAVFLGGTLYGLFWIAAGFAGAGERDHGE
jgi:hypothetical protein